jgi:hypothetical protein
MSFKRSLSEGESATSIRDTSLLPKWRARQRVLHPPHLYLQQGTRVVANSMHGQGHMAGSQERGNLLRYCVDGAGVR